MTDSATLADAVSAHQRGELDAAERGYQAVLEAEPQHAEALHLLGLARAGQGDSARARALIERAIEIQPDNIAFRNNLGSVLAQQSEWEAAQVAFRAVLDLAPDDADARFNLGLTLASGGDAAAALPEFERVARARPDDAQVHVEHARALLDTSQPAGASEAARRALELEPRHLPALRLSARAHRLLGRAPEARDALTSALDVAPDDAGLHNNLGNVLRELGDLKGAIEHLRQATTLTPGVATLHVNLARACVDAGDLARALAAFRAGHDIDADAEGALEGIASMLALGAALDGDPCLESDLDAAFASDRVDPQPLARMAAAQVLGRRPVVPLDRDALLAALLARAVNVDPLLERRLVAARRMCLLDDAALQPAVKPSPDARARPTAGLSADRAAASTGAGTGADSATAERPNVARGAASSRGLFADAPGGLFAERPRTLLSDAPRGLLSDDPRSAYRSEAHGVPSGEAHASAGGGVSTSFPLALALQAFANEFAWPVDAEERAEVDRIERELSGADFAALDDDPLLVVRLLRYAAYRPLFAAPFADALAAAASQLLGPLLERALHAPRTEARLGAQVDGLRPVSDTTSAAVRAQYEESPYPRWLSLPAREPRTLGAELSKLLPHCRPAARLADATRPLRVLVAGCGTGWEPLDLARRYVGAEVTAIDLGRASLGYAVREAAARGVSNVRFLHGDILDLDAIDERFHLITSTGVLHHMAEPRAGWEKLLERLADGGVMRIGLYSRIARQSVNRARAYIQKMELGSNRADIVEFRRALLAGELDPVLGDDVATLRASDDVYSVSSLRDLLFHVCEHQLDLTELGELLNDLGLDFLGFEHAHPGVLGRYGQEHPQDATATDLARWNAFERRYPETFAGMYQFWCARKDDVS